MSGLATVGQVAPARHPPGTLGIGRKCANGAYAWLPDGSQVAVAGSADGVRGIYVVSADGGELRFILDIPDDTNTALVSSPDGITLALQDALSGSVDLLRIDGAEPVSVAGVAAIE